MARFSDGTIAEPDIPLIVTIEDENDNPPYFEMHVANISEGSKKGASTDNNKIATFILFDCHPKGKQSKIRYVTSCCWFPPGTFVLQIEGKDNDQAGTINSQIAYRILSQEPEGKHMFSIDETTGKVYVKEDTLDREVVCLFIYFLFHGTH